MKYKKIYIGKEKLDFKFRLYLESKDDFINKYGNNKISDIDFSFVKCKV